MLINEVVQARFVAVEDSLNLSISLFRTDFPLAELSVDRLPVSGGKVSEENVTQIFGANRPIKIAKNQSFHALIIPPDLVLFRDRQFEFFL
jgi:hypothetical protein